MIKIRTYIRNNITEIGILVYLIALFSFFFLFFEVKEYGDSFQLLNQFPTRDPFYSLFLKLCRDIFGEDHYFKIIGFVQNLFAGISIWFLNEYISKVFSFNKIFKVFAVFLLTLPHIVSPLFSATRLILTNAVLTEGIALSMFYIWMIFMLKVIYNDKIGHDLTAFFIALVLSLIRAQLLVCVIAWSVVMAVKVFLNKRWIRILLLYAVCLISMIGRTVFIRNYNEYFWDMHVDTFSGNAMMVANVLYVSESEDGEKIETPYLKEIFNEVIVKMKADGICYSDAGKSLYDKAMLHDNVHDRINFDYFEPVAREYLKEAENLDEMNYLQTMYRVNEIADKLFKELLPRVIKEYAISYISIVGLGLMRSVAVEFEWLIPYVAVVLLAAVAGSIYMLFGKKKKENWHKPAIFMLFVLMMIFGNAAATAFMRTKRLWTVRWRRARRSSCASLKKCAAV